MPVETQQPTELPPYRAVLVVDVKDFSGRKSRFHQQITRDIPLILENAFARCGHADLWGKGIGDTTGDGYFRILDPIYLPYLLNPFLGALQDELVEQNNMVPREYGNLRMRVSLSVGPVTDSGDDVLGDGNGATRIEAHRILDSHPVRDILDRSADVTRVAAIVSQRVYEDAVLSGYAAEEAGEYVEVETEVKTFRGRAYLRVPKPSGGLLRDGFVVKKLENVAAEENVNRVPTPGAAPHFEFHGSATTQMGVGEVYDGLHIGDNYSGGPHDDR
ncbi:hypothetical protein [Saccharopolyspora tripterygii]